MAKGLKITLETSGLREYVASLQTLAKEVDGFVRAAIYEGAGKLTDEVRKNIEDIPTHKSGTPKNPGKPGGIREYERWAMLQGLGIAGARADGDFINAQVGFDGYAVFYDENGEEIGVKPVPMVARSIASGTSFSQKTPFMRTVIATRKREIRRTMVTAVEQQIAAIAQGSNSQAYAKPERRYDASDYDKSLFDWKTRDWMARRKLPGDLTPGQVSYLRETENRRVKLWGRYSGGVSQLVNAEEVGRIRKAKFFKDL